MRPAHAAKQSVGVFLEPLEPRLLLSVDFYVSPAGHDTAAGTITAPFATLARAQQAVRTLKTTSGLPTGGVNVYLRGGTYYIGSTFHLTSQDSGASGKPIVYQAYNSESVQIIGGASLDDSWFTLVTSSSAVYSRVPTAARGHVMEADLWAHGITNLGTMQPRGGFTFNNNKAPTELFFNGQAMQLGRSEGWSTMATASGATFTYSGTGGDKWATAEDPWFSGLWGTYWLNGVYGASKIAAATNTVTLETYPDKGMRAGMPFYALNMLEEIDRPGEYYINRSTGKLYFWAPDAIDNSDKIYVSQMDNDLLWLDGTQYIRFEGVTIEAGRGGLVKISGGSNNSLLNCVLRNSGTFGAEISGVNNGIDSSRIYDTGERAVDLSGGNRPTLTPGGNYVRNSDIYQWGRWVGTSKVGIEISGVGQIVSHNDMHDAPDGAIWYFGNNHLIEYNDIYNVCGRDERRRRHLRRAGLVLPGQRHPVQLHSRPDQPVHHMATVWHLP